MSKKQTTAAATAPIDILELHTQIQQFIETESKNVVVLEAKLVKINQLLECDYLRPRIIYRLKMEKEMCEKLIIEHHNLDFFNIDVAHLIEEYHMLNRTEIVLPFFSPTKDQLTQQLEHKRKKMDLEKQFLNKLKNYTHLKNFEFMMKHCEFIPKSSPPPCVCGNKTEFIKDDDRAVCAICCTEQSLISNTSSFSDVGRVNMASKYTYNRKVHFRDCITQYQGKQKTHIPEEIYTILETKLLEKNLLNTEPGLTVEKRYEKVTRAMVLDILKELGSKDVKKFYDDIVLIHHTLTKQPCDNIEYLEDSLLDDFDKLTETYDNLYVNQDSPDDERGGTKRKNFINAQFVLYQLLRKHNHPCNSMDFLTLKKSERKRFHHTICKKLFSILEWKYSYSIC
ncbi:hypothetical protein MIV079L [Invertebrate iridescent virus 3]|uniref:Putative transcription factor 079L n=1 Tax=Invertebrate iridescent virus 3 TaxID=345201 RepID=VF282_IIV3|nr:hypothetical protein MIV079L [Invertebrate iridescent virus 3]Q196Y1.1 RecName: Full=Putative transcription factor 079L [Invertebrate iridescent virus 3]ABF82109.1 hypothetical protein MIV079L [Invertebrate iridescent virus 3]